MAMSTLDFWNGIVLIVFCALSIYVGLRIMLKYFKYRQRQLLFAGIAWIGLASPWLPASISFIMYFMIGRTLTIVPYLIIGVCFIPIAMTLWMIVFTDLVYKKNQKIIVGTFGIFNLIFEIIFIYFIIVNPSVIGDIKGLTDIQFTTFAIIYFLFLVVTGAVTGIWFSLKSLKSEKPEVKLKGKLLLLAFIFFFIGAGMDAAIPLTWITFPIQRTLEILGAILFYGGFTLPNWMKKLFLRENDDENPIP